MDYMNVCFSLILRSDIRQKSRLSHVNGFLKTAVEQEAGEKVDCKR